MIRRPPRSTLLSSSAASDVYKRQETHCGTCGTCTERREALRLAGIDDKTIYESDLKK